MVADVAVEQVRPGKTDGYVPRPEIGGAKLGSITQFRSEIVIARGRRLARNGNVILREPVQQVDPSKPGGIAPENAAADADRRNSRNVGSVRESRSHDVELIFDTEHAGPERHHVELALKLGAAEGGTLLRIDRFPQFARACAADSRIAIAGIPGEVTEDEAIESRVIGGC